MNVMLLAAGRGERMRPLTDSCPKPLLVVGGKPLIVWHLERLATAGFKRIVINHAHLGKQIENTLQDGSQWGLKLSYSPEPPGALETAGGIANAISLLGNQPFLVINSDIFCDWDVSQARQKLGGNDLAHLILVANPEHHVHGDFGLDGSRVLAEATAEKLTFAGIGIYRPELFADIAPGQPGKLAPLLRAAMLRRRVSGEFHRGEWTDVGTPERLNELNAMLSMNPPARHL